MNQKDFIVAPFSRLVVGDPLYLVNMKTKKSTTKYIANFNKIPIGNRLTGVILTESEDGILTNNKIIIYSLKSMPFTEQLIEIHKQGGFIPKVLEEHRFLKNDRKRLALYVDDRRNILELDDEGDCGHIFTYQKNIGFFVEIETNDLESLMQRNYNLISTLFNDIKERGEN